MQIQITNPDGSLSATMLQATLQAMSDSLDTAASRLSTLEGRVDAGETQHNDNAAKIAANASDLETVAKTVEGIGEAVSDAMKGDAGGAVRAGFAVEPWLLETAHRVEMVFAKMFGASAAVRTTAIPAPAVDAAASRKE